MHIRPAARFRLETALFFIAMAGFSCAATYGGWFRGMDLAIHDTWLSVYPLPLRDDLLIVGIDERSLQRHGRWPWPRAEQARLLDVIGSGNPRAVLLDVVYAGRSATQQDQVLVRAASALPLLALPMIVDALATGGQLIEVLPFPDLLAAADVVGHAHVELDADAIARSTYLRQGVGDAHWPHVALALAQRLEPTRTLRIDCPDDGGYSIQNVRCGFVYVRFAGPPGSLPEVSAADLLSGALAPDVLRDRIVLVGITTSAAPDVVTSPVSGRSRPMAGVEFNANLLNAILQGALIRGAGGAWIYLLTLLCVSLPVLVLPRLKPKAMLLAALATALVPLFVTSVAQLALLLHLPLSSAVIAALLAYPYWSWRRHEVAWRFVETEMSRVSLEGDRWLSQSETGDPPTALNRLAALLAAELRWEDGGSVGGQQETAELRVDLALPRQAVLRRDAAFSPEERALAQRVAERLRVPSEPPEVLPGEQLAARIRRLQNAARDVRLGREVGLRSLQEMPNGVAVLSLLGEVLFLNAAAKTLLRLNEDAPPTDYAELLSGLVPPLGRSWRDVASAVVLEQRSVSFETRTDDAMTVLVDAAVLASPGEPVEHWVVTVTDMSDIRMAEREREEALAFLSHDLRSPMLSVLALVRSAPYSELLASIGRYAEKAFGASEQFLQLSRVQARGSFEVFELDLLSVLSNAADQVFVLAKERDITIELDPFIEEHEDGVWFNGNGELLERAFVNLLSNAIKYSDAGGRVKLTLSHQPGSIAVSVVDQGVGIPEGEQERVFEPFFRSSERELAERRGAGLGLRFVKTVVERHGGEIRLQSSFGAGSRFTVILPELPQPEVDASISE